MCVCVCANDGKRARVRSTVIAPPRASLPPSSSPQSEPAATSRPKHLHLTRLPAALLACVFSCGSVRDHAALAATCSACDRVTKLDAVAASPRFVRYSALMPVCDLDAGACPEAPVSLLRLRPTGFSSAPGTWHTPDGLRQLVDGGCLGSRSLTALNLRVLATLDGADDKSSRECAPTFSELDRLADAAPRLTYFVLRLSHNCVLFRDAGGPASRLALPFARMTALHTLALVALPIGAGGAFVLPPALHTLHVGSARIPDLAALVEKLASGTRVAVANEDKIGGGSGDGGGQPWTPSSSSASRSPLRNLSLPIICGDMWSHIARGLPELTALESLGGVDMYDEVPEEDDAEAAANRQVFEFPALRQFSCTFTRLASLSAFRMPALDAFKVRNSATESRRIRDRQPSNFACVRVRARACVCVSIQLRGGEFSAGAARHFDRFLARTPGLTALSLSQTQVDPFIFYRGPATRHRLSTDVFRSVTTLSIGTRTVPASDGGSAPDALSLMFPSLTRLVALGRDNGLPRLRDRGCDFVSGDVHDRGRDSASDDVHAGVRSLDFSEATEFGDAALAKLPNRFPNLVEFVAPAKPAGPALTAAIAGWRRTLVALDLSRVPRLEPMHLALVLNVAYGAFRRLRLASWHRPLETRIGLLLAQRLADSLGRDNSLKVKDGVDDDGRVTIEWAPLPSDACEPLPSLATPFVGF